MTAWGKFISTLQKTSQFIFNDLRYIGNLEINPLWLDTLFFDSQENKRIFDNCASVNFRELLHEDKAPQFPQTILNGFWCSMNQFPVIGVEYSCIISVYVLTHVIIFRYWLKHQWLVLFFPHNGERWGGRLGVGVGISSAKPLAKHRWTRLASLRWVRQGNGHF